MTAASFLPSTAWTSSGVARRPVRVVEQFLCSYPLKGPTNMFLFLRRPHKFTKPRNETRVKRRTSLLYNSFQHYLLTPWCRVLLEQLTGLQLVKKFPAFHGTRRFITALTNVRHLSTLSEPNPVHIPTSHLLEIHSNIIHPSAPRSPQWSLSLRFPQQDPINPPLLTHTRHMPSPSHSSRLFSALRVKFWSISAIQVKNFPSFLPSFLPSSLPPFLFSPSLPPSFPPFLSSVLPSFLLAWRRTSLAFIFSNLSLGFRHTDSVYRHFFQTAWPFVCIDTLLLYCCLLSLFLYYNHFVFPVPHLPLASIMSKSLNGYLNLTVQWVQARAADSVLT